MSGVKIEMGLKITILAHCGETEDDIYKHLCNILYDRDHDITEVEEIALSKKEEEKA